MFINGANYFGVDCICPCLLSVTGKPMESPSCSLPTPTRQKTRQGKWTRKGVYTTKAAMQHYWNAAFSSQSSTWWSWFISCALFHFHSLILISLSTASCLGSVPISVCNHFSFSPLLSFHLHIHFILITGLSLYRTDQPSVRVIRELCSALDPALQLQFKCASFWSSAWERTYEGMREGDMVGRWY